LQLQYTLAKNRYDSFEDRGVVLSLFGRLVIDKLVDIHQHLWAQGTGVGLRDKLSWSWTFAMTLRGESIRRLNLSDISMIKMPASEGPHPATMLVATFRKSKTVKLGSKISVSGAMRHIDVRV
jgi:hypothetical protein